MAIEGSPSGFAFRFGWLLSSEEAGADLKKETCGKCVSRGLQESGNEGSISADSVEECQGVGVKRQAEESLPRLALPMQNAERPIIIEAHVSFAGKEVGRTRELEKCEQAEEQDRKKDAVDGPEASRRRRRG